MQMILICPLKIRHGIDLYVNLSSVFDLSLLFFFVLFLFCFSACNQLCLAG